MNQNWILFFFSYCYLGSIVHGARYIDDELLWKNVVTIDRLVWLAQSDSKNRSKLVDDLTFVRRVYLDITGKIPTYQQLSEFMTSKSLTKRQDLIDKLLSSPGYVSHFSVFWNDLLRTSHVDAAKFLHQEPVRYTERFLYENKPYDKIVYDFIMSEGTIVENPAVSFYLRDSQTDIMDTLNSTIRAFLGTRIGCAQCHNHRFDKWTQKEFYELASFLWGTKCGRIMTSSAASVNKHHHKHLRNMKGHKIKFTHHVKRLLNPSRGKVIFQEDVVLSYPDNYAYENAKPFEKVKERIVFDYGDLKVEGKDRREVFAKWLTSKNNINFSRMMANRLWKRIFGIGVAEPIDDWKDNIEIKNKELFEVLGNTFVDVNYDFKAFLTILFNSEAYQYSIFKKGELSEYNYQIQGAVYKRMSSAQINDSLLTLRFGDLDRYSKISDDYFALDDAVSEVISEYIPKLVPMLQEYNKKNGRLLNEINSDLIDLMKTYALKVNEIEEYHNVDEYGYIIHDKEDNVGKDIFLKAVKVVKGNQMTMTSNKGSKKHDVENSLKRANYTSSEFQNIFGMLDRSKAETRIDDNANVKQILKMINSKESRLVVEENSNLMKELFKRNSFKSRVNYLYFSIYGREPDESDIRIAKSFLKKSNDIERWSKYTLALLNSPEFYFIK